MVQVIKMAARVVAVTAMGLVMVSVFSALVAIFVGTEGISAITWGIGTAKAFIDNWLPINGTLLLTVAGSLITLEIGLLTFRIAKIVQKVVFKISEG